MPVCKQCGNSRLFGSSKVPPAAPTANGPVSGLLGNFEPGGELATVSRVGADKKTARQAGVNPQEYFDICLRCGSQQIDWQ